MKLPYPPDIRSEAARLAKRVVVSVRRRASELAVSYDRSRRWIKWAGLDAGERHDGLTAEVTSQGASSENTEISPIG
jgi:hypothetical protein